MLTSATSSGEQAFLDDLDKKLWNAADRLRQSVLQQAFAANS